MAVSMLTKFQHTYYTTDAVVTDLTISNPSWDGPRRI